MTEVVTEAVVRSAAAWRLWSRDGRVLAPGMFPNAYRCGHPNSDLTASRAGSGKNCNWTADIPDNRNGCKPITESCVGSTKPPAKSNHKGLV
jgi:hypothetical protein